MKVVRNNKPQFIREFLHNFQLRKRESVFLLNHFLANEKLLENIHFVDDPQGLNNVVIMSTICSKTSARLQLIRNEEIIFDPEVIFNTIRRNPEEHFYIVIEAGSSLYSLKNYVNVVKENPNAELPIEYSQEADELIEELLLRQEKKYLLDQIDKTLESKDEETFIKLTKELSKLN